MNTPQPEPAFTIGIPGGCGTGIRAAQYYEQIAAYYLQTMPRVRMLFPLAGKGERTVAAYLLERRAAHPGLQVALVLTARQGQDYRLRVSGGSADACNPLIDAADRYEVMEQYAVRFGQQELFRLFIERCDLLVFSEHRAGWAATSMLYKLIDDMVVPLPVQYELGSPGYTYQHYPADRKQYRTYGSLWYDPYRELRQSIAYLRRNNFTISADRLPMVFLRKWLTQPPPGWYHHLATPDDTDGIMHLRETRRLDWCSLKVFACAYAARHDLWAEGRDNPSQDDAIRRFRQFRSVLETIADRRDAGQPVESFDLLNFDGYDLLFQRRKG